MSAKTKTVAGEERREFQAEATRLLHLMTHSIYSEKEVFLRELISNAADACDKLRWRALTEPGLVDGAPDFRVRVTIDAAAKTLTVADNGVGMDREELIENLGTIARSGTHAFAANLTGDQKADTALIGQFGVGFYASFIVADRVVVTSRKAGDAETWEWESDGMGGYATRPAEDASRLIADRGVAVTLHLRAGEEEFLGRPRLTRIVKTYSDHVAIPVEIVEAGSDDAPERVNAASALWMRPKSEITDEQYAEFYRDVARMYDEPAWRLHWRAEGRHEYSALLFCPSTRPFDFFDPARKGRVKLYVRRVFVTDEAALLPAWLRFVRGVVDSEDMPLNISREMLQNNPMVAAIRQALTRKVLQELQKLAKDKPADYIAFWDAFGPALKEGLYEDPERSAELLGLARFRTTASKGDLRSLADYVSAMKENQTSIYYVTGETEAAAAKSPQLEGYAARGVEVLLLSDPVDEFWVANVEGFDGKPFRSVTRGASDLTDIAADEDDAADAAPPTEEGQLATLIALMKQALGDEVRDVRRSDRLRESAVCLVADDSGLDMRLERMLAAHKQLNGEAGKRVLEINPRHALIAALAQEATAGGRAAEIEDAARLLLDQARVAEGEALPDPTAFARRLATLMTARFAA